MGKAISTGCKQTMFIGDRFLVKDGWCEVIKYDDKSNVTVKFDVSGFEAKGATYEIRGGTISDHTVPSVYGVGFLGKQYLRGSEHKYFYNIWTGILERCYNDCFKSRHPTYNECVVSDAWLDFSVFLEDVRNMKRQEKWEIDKDLLVSGNKIYGRDFCVFLPREINVQVRSIKPRELPLGVYAKGGKYAVSSSFRNHQYHLGTFDHVEDARKCSNEFRKRNILILAEDYKHLLDERAYAALINYKESI